MFYGNAKAQKKVLLGRRSNISLLKHIIINISCTIHLLPYPAIPPAPAVGLSLMVTVEKEDEEWKNGRMEAWKNGRMEAWKNGSMWKHVEACGSTWKHVEACGSMRKHVEACGSMWKHVEACGSMWKRGGSMEMEAE